MSVVEALRELGGVATRAQLWAATSRSETAAAVAAGVVIRVGYGRYALPEVEQAERLAHEVSGLLCLTSAALHHGWAVLHVPERPHVLFPTNRKLSAVTRAAVQHHRGQLAAGDWRDVATSPEQTLEMCLRSLPFADALAVADSARRADVDPGLFRRLTRVRGPGSAQVRRVVDLSRAEPANPFESALRAIALTVPGLNVRPQVPLRWPGFFAQPDLVDTDLGIVLEADSFEWHGGRGALHRDANRYNALVVHGWIVLRFSWEQVMFHPEEVRATLVAAVELASSQARRLTG